MRKQIKVTLSDYKKQNKTDGQYNSCRHPAKTPGMYLLIDSALKQTSQIASLTKLQYHAVVDATKGSHKIPNLDKTP